jgi:hypothetical protein
MQPKWANIFLFLLLMVAVICLAKLRWEAASFLSNLGNIGPYHTPEEQMKGLIALTFCIVCILAILKTILRGKE